MKMSGIVVGGLIGAAAALYFSRSKRAFSFSGFRSAGQAIDGLVEKARSRMMSSDKRSYYGSQTGSAAPSAPGGLERAETIVKNDPALRKEVNDILSETPDSPTVR